MECGCHFHHTFETKLIFMDNKRIWWRLIIWVVIWMGTGLCAYGQSDPLLRQLALALENQFGDLDRRGERFTLWVSKTEDGRLESSGDSVGTRIGREILRRFDSFAEGMDAQLEYEVSLYWDSWTDQQYAVVWSAPKPLPGTSRVLEWAGHNELHPGMPDNFPEKIYADLKLHANELERLPLHNWDEPLKFILDSKSRFSVLPQHALSPYLSESLKSKWKPAIYNGHASTVMMRFQIHRSVVLSGEEFHWRTHDVRYSFTHMLAEHFNGQWVSVETRLNERWPPKDKKILISLVYDPMTATLRTPLIHAGPVSEAQQLIDWLQQQSIPAYLFAKDFAGRPELRRSFFFIEHGANAEPSSD